MGGGDNRLFSGIKENSQSRKSPGLFDDDGNQAYNNTVLEKLNELLSEFNDRDSKKTNIHLSEIKKAIEKNIEGTVDTLFGGSVSKNTYVDGLSDIDTLIILNGTDLKGKSPGYVKKLLEKVIRDRYPLSKITVGKLAITVGYSDCELQLLPAIKNGQKIIIPDSNGKKWSKIDPKGFSKKLTDVNKKNEKHVIPVIKLAKAAINNFSRNRQISGYHVESLAVEVFKNYSGEFNNKTMLQHFFKEVPKRILSPITDKTGQSYHVDDYLGSANSDLRKAVSATFSRINKRLSRADDIKSTDAWDSILG
jgi:hypothetical protein